MEASRSYHRRCICGIPRCLNRSRGSLLFCCVRNSIARGPCLRNHQRFCFWRSDEKAEKPTAKSQTAQNRLGVARGTYVMTARGEMPVERLSVGDRVITRDHGMQAIRWIGSEKKHVTAENAPVLLKKARSKTIATLSSAQITALSLKAPKP